MKTYKELNVWQKSMDLIEEIYKITCNFPSEEKFGISMQMRRASVSIPSNIAEGWGRSSLKEYIQLLVIARGSLMELETQLEISKRLNYVRDSDMVLNLISEVGKMLNGLLGSLKNKLPVTKNLKPGT